jgi:ribose transport system substrate-binding protein
MLDKDKLGPIHVPIVTPYAVDQSVDHARLRHLATFLVEKKMADTLILSGTTGEFHTQTFDERVAIFETVKDAVGGQVPLVAGGADCRSRAYRAPKNHSRRKSMKSTTRLVALCALASALLTGHGFADTSKMRIAFSNNYAGNSWRQAMLKTWDVVTKKAVADHVVAAADVFTTADREVPTQAAQIQNLILQGYNAIVIDGSSPDALNGAVKQACDAGIVVVSFDGIVTEPCAWRIVAAFKNYGEREVEFLGQHLPKGGNLLEIRGLAGTLNDATVHSGVEAGLAKYPKLKVVASVTGDWDETTAQKAVASVLPSLPDIAGVVDQGGDGYGAAQAFKVAGRPTPVIPMGNRYDELKWWQEQAAANGYQSWSSSIAPGIATLAFWVAQQILDGRKDIPHDLLVPYLEIDQAHLDEAVKSTPVGGVADKEYSLEDANKVIQSNMK